MLWLLFTILISFANAECIDIGFNQISGALKQISAASDGTVYGTNIHNKIYRLNANGNSWSLVNDNSRLNRISVGSSDEVYGLNGIYVYKLNPDKISFRYIAGKLLRDISVGSDGEVWGIDLNYDIYRLNSDETWSKILGMLGQIDVASANNIIGVHTWGLVYRRNVQENKWELIPSTTQWIEVSIAEDGTVYGIDPDHNIYRLNGCPGSSWTKICGTATTISVAKQGQVFIIDDNDKIYVAVPPSCLDIGFNMISGSLLDISAASDGTVYGIGYRDYNYNKIYRLNSNGYSWSLIDEFSKAARISVGSSDHAYVVAGFEHENNVYTFLPNESNKYRFLYKQLVNISVGVDGEVWGVDSSDYIYRLNSDESWSQISGQLIQIDVASANDIMGVNKWGKIYQRNIAANKWDQITPNDQLLFEVSIAEDGTVYGTDANHDIYRWNNCPYIPSPWIQVCGRAKSLSVAKEDAVYIIGEANEVYTTAPFSTPAPVPTPAPQPTPNSCGHAFWDDTWYCQSIPAAQCVEGIWYDYCQTGCHKGGCPNGYAQLGSQWCGLWDFYNNEMCHRVAFAHNDILNIDNQQNKHYNQYDGYACYLIIILFILSISMILCVIYKYCPFTTKQNFQVIPSINEEDVQFMDDK